MKDIPFPPTTLTPQYGETREFLPLSQLGPELAGIPRGGLVEWCGPAGGGKTSLLLRALSAGTGTIAWIQNAAEPGEAGLTPEAVVQHGVSLDRWLGIEVGPRDFAWCVLQILKSRAVEIVITVESLANRLGVEGRPEHATQLRRMQIAAERSRGTVVFLRNSPTRAGSWPIALQVWIDRQSSEANPFHVEVLKWKSKRAVV